MNSPEAALPVRVGTRYVAPLREGGSLPGLMEADDLGTYVVKFRGAGQGPKVLVAEVICAGLARALELPVPDLVAIELDPALAPGEPDEEIQALLKASAGLNLGVDYLPGALDFDPADLDRDLGLAGQVLWFDAFVQNADRSWRNPNMLHWHDRLILIDHGAALTFHHDWTRAEASVARPYDIGEHALVRFTPDVTAAAEICAPRVTDDLLRSVLAVVPDEWLVADDERSPDELRAAYVARLRARLDAQSAWLPALAEAAAAGPVIAERGSNRPAWLDRRGRGGRA
ncbi:HipA family kinase [Sporichthya polymorpha]|uniref:HipA family kinase n=1 Tax=Sporichthya polymorpha TaxID=35751 RepID=UPI00035CC139|nr:HipA family kinase [Sporichthya polymorpha]